MSWSSLGQTDLVRILAAVKESSGPGLANVSEPVLRARSCSGADRTRRVYWVDMYTVLVAVPTLMGCCPPLKYTKLMVVLVYLCLSYV